MPPTFSALVAALSFFLSLMLLFSANPAQATSYTLQDDYFGTTPSDLFNWFTFETEDPTSGSVRYVSAAEAESSNLIGFAPAEKSSLSKFRAYVGIGVPGAPSAGSPAVAAAYGTPPQSGVPSVRASSKKAYSAGMLLITSVSHIPTGCGTWPAFWLLGTGQQWPAAGEIDVIEQVNGLPGTRNSMTLHTGPGCSLSANNSSKSYSGTLVSQDCNINDPKQSKNEGCQIDSTDDRSFGEGLNKAGGGVYAMEWTSSGISVWFWSHAAAVPAAVTSANPDPSQFGLPTAKFDGAGCVWDKAFQNLQVLINTELCGEWAGSDDVWASSGCKAQTGKATCKEFVMAGKELEEAYWLLDGLKVFKA